MTTGSDAPYPAITNAIDATQAGSPLGASRDCPSCGGGMPMSRSIPYSSNFVYSIGVIVPQFPDLGTEKEFAQLGVLGERGNVENSKLQKAMKNPANAYLRRQLCWVFRAADHDAFIIEQRDDAEITLLVDSLSHAQEQSAVLHVMVGTMTTAVPHSACARAVLPPVAIDQYLSFPLEAFIESLREASGAKEAKTSKEDTLFEDVARDVFARFTRRTDNLGMSDEHRALNYLALRYPPIYRLVADALRADKLLLDVQVRPGGATHGGPRRMVAVRLIFRSRRTEVVERYQCTVDVTDRFPFLERPLSIIYD